MEPFLRLNNEITCSFGEQEPIPQLTRITILVPIEEQCFASSLKVWQERLGYTNYNDLKRLFDHVEGMKICNEDEGICECCETNKPKRRPVSKDTVTRATEVLEIVHTDVLGPIANESPDNFKYAIGFVDSFSRFIKVY